MRNELKHLYSATILVSIFGEDLSEETIHLVDIDTGAPYTKPLFEALLETSPVAIQMIFNPVKLLCTKRLNTWRLTNRERRIR